MPADQDIKTTIRHLTEQRGAGLCLRLRRFIPNHPGHVVLYPPRRLMHDRRDRGNADLVTFSALELFHFARTIRGCVAGSLNAQADLPRFFDWVRNGALDLKLLVTGHGSLADVNLALEELASARGVRTMVRPSASP